MDGCRTGRPGAAESELFENGCPLTVPLTYTRRTAPGRSLHEERRSIDDYIYHVAKVHVLTKVAFGSAWLPVYILAAAEKLPLVSEEVS